MEEERVELPEEMPEEEIIQAPEAYNPRPSWQVWAARIGLIIVIIGIALYYYHIARGG